MVQSPGSSNTQQLSQVFFERLLDRVASILGSEFVYRFEELKRQRERFLRDQWTLGEGDTTDRIFREVDYEYLLASLRKQPDLSTEVLTDAHIQLARICYQFGELQKAFDLLEYARQHTLDELSTQKGEVYQLLGQVEVHRNHWDQARHWLTEALHFYESTRNTEGMVTAHIHLGIFTAQRWDIPAALEHFEQGRTLLKSEQDDQLKFKIESNLAIIEGMLGDSAEAAEKFQQLLGYDIANQPEYRIHLQINRGMVMRENGKLEEAELLLEEAVKSAEALPNARLIGLGSIALAENLIRIGKYDDGQRRLIKAFKIFSKQHDRASLADAYRIFGILHRETGYPELAAAKLEISLAMNEESGNLLNLLETHYEYSLLARNQNDIEQQKYHLEESLRYAQEMGATNRINKFTKELEALC